METETPANDNRKGKLAAALARAQAEFPEIERSRTVTVRSDKGSYTFDYAPLDAIYRVVRGPLAKNGLALFHRVDAKPEAMTVTAVLAHESGEEETCPITFPFEYQKVQQLGSLVTYLKRYSTEAILGICAEQDDDGNAADGNHREMRDKSRAPAKPSAAPQSQAVKSPQGGSDPGQAALDGIEPDLLTDEQDLEIGRLFKVLKFSKPQAVKTCQDVTGKSPAHLLKPDADKLIAHLNGLVEKQKELAGMVAS